MTIHGDCGLILLIVCRAVECEEVGRGCAGESRADSGL